MTIKLIKYGSPILQRKVKPVALPYNSLATLVKAMEKIMYTNDGCGLAAPQVNKDMQLFIIDSTLIHNRQKNEGIKKRGLDYPGIKEVFINPVITEYGSEKSKITEGCLSIPEIEVQITRSLMIQIEYYDAFFKLQKKTYHGTTARIIQHEYDHLQGKLILDYLSPVRKKLLANKLQRLLNGTD
ncbi:MAG: peptide deformylase [Phycisphaerales bacterium]|nr:peptide deformylase [Phycisphaerales bacterium]